MDPKIGPNAGDSITEKYFKDLTYQGKRIIARDPNRSQKTGFARAVEQLKLFIDDIVTTIQTGTNKLSDQVAYKINKKTDAYIKDLRNINDTGRPGTNIENKKLHVRLSPILTKIEEYANENKSPETALLLQKIKDLKTGILSFENLYDTREKANNKSSHNKPKEEAEIGPSSPNKIPKVEHSSDKSKSKKSNKSEKQHSSDKEAVSTEHTVDSSAGKVTSQHSKEEATVHHHPSSPVKEEENKSEKQPLGDKEAVPTEHLADKSADKAILKHGKEEAKEEATVSHHPSHPAKAEENKSEKQPLGDKESVSAPPSPDISTKITRSTARVKLGRKDKEPLESARAPVEASIDKTTVANKTIAVDKIRTTLPQLLKDIEKAFSKTNLFPEVRQYGVNWIENSGNEQVIAATKLFLPLFEDELTNAKAIFKDASKEQKDLFVRAQIDIKELKGLMEKAK